MAGSDVFLCPGRRGNAIDNGHPRTSSTAHTFTGQQDRPDGALYPQRTAANNGLPVYTGQAGYGDTVPQRVLCMCLDQVNVVQLR
ncbi:hypothetical protein ES703_49366 [subsurface metagenome]